MIPVTHDQRIAKFVSTYISIPAGLGIRLADYGLDPLAGWWEEIDELLTESRDVLASGEDDYAGTFRMMNRAEWMYKKMTTALRNAVYDWRQVHPRQISDIRKSTDELDWLYMEVWDELGGIGEFITDLRDYLDCNHEFRVHMRSIGRSLADGVCQTAGVEYLELTNEDYLANDSDPCRYRWCVHELCKRLFDIVVDPRYAFSAGEMMFTLEEITVLHRNGEDAAANNLIAYAHNNTCAWETLIKLRANDLAVIHDNVLRMLVSDPRPQASSQTRGEVSQ